MMAFSARGGSGRSGGSGDSLSRRTREAAQLSEVLEEANVPLQRRADGSVWATCPFHGDGNERTPSMKVDDEAGTFYCFACKESGSVFDFVMKTEDVDFGEARPAARAIASLPPPAPDPALVSRAALR